MDPSIYANMVKMEKTHWWFVGRRRILEDMIRHTIPLPPACEILEAGCGTGGNLEMLARFGRTSAMEPEPDALKTAAARRTAVVRAGGLPDMIPFGKQQFDMIAMLDVLEHVDDDAGSLLSLFKRLKPGGHMLITVPAFPLLWSNHDVLHHHKRRYVRGQLLDRVRKAGFEVKRCSYFNTWLFPIVLAARLLFRHSQNHDMQETIGPLNNVLTWIFGSERFLLRFLSFPFGVSIALVARRPA